MQQPLIAGSGCDRGSPERLSSRAVGAHPEQDQVRLLHVVPLVRGQQNLPLPGRQRQREEASILHRKLAIAQHACGDTARI